MSLRQNREAISWNPVQMRQGLLRASTLRDFASAKLVFLRVRFLRTALPAARIGAPAEQFRNEVEE